MTAPRGPGAPGPRWLHRFLLVGALGASAAVLLAVVTGTAGRGLEFVTVFREAPGRDAGFGALLSIALFFPFFGGLVAVIASWSRGVPAGEMARWFCFTAAALQLAATALGPEAPRAVLASGALLFFLAGLTARVAPAPALLEPAPGDRLHRQLGWGLLAGSVGLDAWLVIELLRVDDLVSRFGRRDMELLMAVLLVPSTAAAMLLAASDGRSPEKREPARLLARAACAGAVLLLGGVLVAGWPVPKLGLIAEAASFLVVAALPWRDAREPAASVANRP